MSSCAPKQLFEAESIDKDFEKNVEELMKKEDLMMKNFSFKLNSYDCLIKSDIQDNCMQIFYLTCSRHL